MWCQKWQLPLNTKKCKAMCISPSFTYYISNNAQVTESVSKALWVLHLLRRRMNVCTMEAKKKAYTALVRPVQEYIAPVGSRKNRVISPYWRKYRTEQPDGSMGPDGFRSITTGPTPTLIYATNLIGLPSMIGALYYVIVRPTRL